MKAIFAGAFDPFTLGHKDIAERATQVFGAVIIAVAEDTGKNSTALDIRIDIAKKAMFNVLGVTVVPFSGLLSEFLKSQGDCILVRGIRNSRDAEYERDHARIYNSLSGKDTVCFITAAKYEHISSTAVRELAALGGNLSGYVVSETEKIIKNTYFRSTGKGEV